MEMIQVNFSNAVRHAIETVQNDPEKITDFFVDEGNHSMAKPERGDLDDLLPTSKRSQRYHSYKHGQGVFAAGATGKRN